MRSAPLIRKIEGAAERAASRRARWGRAGSFLSRLRDQAHLDALLRDFVRENRALFWFWGDLPTESALSEAGWRYFADGYLALRDESALSRLELVDDLHDRQMARRRNQRFVKRYEAMQDSGTIDPYFAAVLVVCRAAGSAHPAAYPPQIEGRPGTE
jgi:hypothetical protein